MAVELFVDVITKDSAAGSEYVAGFGPLQVLRWTSSSEMDRAGTFAFDVLSNETTLSAIRRLRKVRCYAFVNNVLTEVGNGIIDKISTELDGSERTLLRVSGYDMLWELNYRSVGFLDLSDVLFGLTHSVALSAIMAFAPSGWTATPSGSPGNDYVYRRFAGESVLAALNYLSVANDTHFRITGFRELEFRSDVDNRSVVLSKHNITKVMRRQVASDFCTRIYAYGAGNDSAKITLEACTRTPPAGYTLDTTNNYIKHDGYESSVDRIDKYIQYNEINALITNRLVNAESAANMLFNVALHDLKERVSAFESNIYDLELANCPQVIKPLDGVYVTHFDATSGININGLMWVTRASISVDTRGIQTTSLTVSDAPIRIRTENEILIEMIQHMKNSIGVNQPGNENFAVDFIGTVEYSVSTIVVPVTIPGNLYSSYTMDLYFKILDGGYTPSTLYWGAPYLNYNTGMTIPTLNPLTTSESLGDGWYRKNIPVTISPSTAVTYEVKITYNGNYAASTIEGFVHVTGKKV